MVNLLRAVRGAGLRRKPRRWGGDQPPPGAGNGHPKTTIALAVLLLAYANVDAWVAMRRQRPVVSPVNISHLMMLLLTLLWAGAERLPSHELGLTRRGAGRSLGWGALVGIAGSAAIRLFFVSPLVTRRAVTQPEIHGLGRRRLLVLLAGQTFLSTSVFEEVAFRGVLHAKLVRLFGVRRALLVGGGLFAAWHAVIAWHNLLRSDVPRRLQPALYLGAMIVLFLVGLLFGALRHATGHVAGGIAAHWLMVATITLEVAGAREGDG